MKMKEKVKVGVFGSGGVAAQELIKLLSEGGLVEFVFLQSASLNKRKHVFLNTKYEDLSDEEAKDKKPDVVFFATPNKLTMIRAGFFLNSSIKVVDLSADYRFRDVEVFNNVYNTKHPNPSIAGVYGLTEVFEDEIKKAKLVANPGCYVTACLLALWPIKEMVKTAVFDCKSGYSGAGKSFDKKESLSSNTIIPYKITEHRHEAEIQQFVNFPVFFTPHLINRFRGLEATCHFILKDEYKNTDFSKLYQGFYKNKKNIKIESGYPNINGVVGTNNCSLGGFEVDKKGRLVIISALDNLIKGASGQAYENFKLMFNLE